MRNGSLSLISPNLRIWQNSIPLTRVISRSGARETSILNGAKAWEHEKNGLTVSEKVKVDLVERDGNYMLETNLYEVLGDFSSRMINTEVLGKAFEPEEPFENPDGTPIQFDADYFGGHRGAGVLPGPFAAKEDAEKKLY